MNPVGWIKEKLFGGEDFDHDLSKVQEPEMVVISENSHREVFHLPGEGGDKTICGSDPSEWSYRKRRRAESSGRSLCGNCERRSD